MKDDIYKSDKYAPAKMANMMEISIPDHTCNLLFCSISKVLTLQPRSCESKHDCRCLRCLLSAMDAQITMSLQEMFMGRGEDARSREDSVPPRIKVAIHASPSDAYAPKPANHPSQVLRFPPHTLLYAAKSYGRQSIFGPDLCQLWQNLPLHQQS